MTKDQMIAEKEKLTAQYEDMRDKTSQVLGALLWLTKKINEEGANG